MGQVIGHSTNKTNSETTWDKRTLKHANFLRRRIDYFLQTIIIESNEEERKIMFELLRDSVERYINLFTNTKQNVN